MRNFQQIVKDVSNLKWSTVVLEEAFAEVEDNVKLAVRQANSYIFGLKDFPFRIKKGGLTTKENAFPAPNGDILQMWMQNGGRYLQKIAPEDGDLLDVSKTGRPELYWADFGDNGAVVHLWPVPDRKYAFFYRYANNMKARDAAGNEKFNLENLDDVVNIPDNPAIEDLFIRCGRAKRSPTAKSFIRIFGTNLIGWLGLKPCRRWKVTRLLTIWWKNTANARVFISIR